MTRNKLRLSLSLTALCLAGCGTVHATGQTSTYTTGSAPIDAALVTADFGWVLTPDRLLLTQDGGRTFSAAAVPVPATDARAAYFRDDHVGYVVAASGNVLTVARTSDGGRSWQVGAARDTAAPLGSRTEYGRLRMSFGDQTHGAVLAQTSASAMSSTATLFATEDGGASWSARSAPANGEIRTEPGGRIWLAGGVVGDQLYSSPDLGRHWSSATVDVGGQVSAKAVSPPVGDVLPVTVVTSADTGQTQVALLTSADGGRSWRGGDRVAVQGRTGAGVRVPVGFTGHGPLVLDTAGGHAYLPHRAGTAAADLRPAGLPEGSDAVTFAPDGLSGWVLAVYGKCAHGKSECTLYHALLATSDGGTTWHQTSIWQQKLN